MSLFEQLGRHAANALVKQAAEEEADKKKKKKPSEANKIVNMDSTSGRLADYLAPGLWGGERAGRTQAMAEAIGEPTTFGVRHPVTSGLMHAVGKTGLGTVGGAALGGLLAKALGADTHDTQGGMILGGAAGGLLGYGKGIYDAGKSRRNEMKRINHFYDEDVAAGKVNPKDPKFSLLSALLLPTRGPHRTGQLEAVKAMRGESSIRDEHDGLRDALYAANVLAPIGVFHGYGQNLRTQLGDGKPEEPKAQFVRRGGPAA